MKPKILLVGYNGANNTGAEAKLLVAIDEIRKVLGEEAELTIPTLNEVNIKRYVREGSNVKIKTVRPWIFPLDVRKLVKETDLVMLVEGSTYMDTWGSALLWYLWVADLSLMPRSQGLPTMLTASALALRVTRKIIQTKGKRSSMAERNSFINRLKDGRRLSYAEFGVPNGKPLFHFHGYPGSRFEGKLVCEAAANCGVRLIAIDRPGMGFSDAKPNRSILDWPEDVVELADSIGIDRFAVEGVSGGGPYSLACAYKIANRITKAGVISGTCPFWDAGTPWERPDNVKSVEDFWGSFSQNLPKPDQEFLFDPKIKKLLSEELFEAFRQGAEGVNQERELYGKPWGFRLEDIPLNVKVYVWHGKLDLNVPFSSARAMALSIPNCKAVFYPNEGHYSSAFKHLKQIFNTLIS